MNHTPEEEAELAEALLEQIFPAAAAVIAEGEEHLPMFVVGGDNMGYQVISALPVPSKDALAFIHKELAAQEGVLVTILIIEAWMLDSKKVPEEEFDRIARHEMSISDSAYKVEVLGFNILTRTRQGFSWCPIDREARTLTKVPVQWLDAEGERHTGRFIRDPSVTN